MNNFVSFSLKNIYNTVFYLLKAEKSTQIVGNIIV